MRIACEGATARALQTTDPPAASRLWTIDHQITDLAPMGRDPCRHRERLRLAPNWELHALLASRAESDGAGGRDARHVRLEEVRVAVELHDDARSPDRNRGFFGEAV
jgi:hypothetical protein